MDLLPGGPTEQDRAFVTRMLEVEERSIEQEFERDFERVVQAALSAEEFFDSVLGQDVEFDQLDADIAAYRDAELATEAAGGPVAERPECASGSLAHEFAALDRIVSGLQRVEHDVSALQAERVELLAAAEAWAQDAAEVGIIYGDSPSEKRGYAQRTIVAEIAAALHQSERTISRSLSQAHSLSRLPATLAALREGRIGIGHARVIVETCDSVPVSARLELEEALLPIAREKTPAILGRKARTLREKVHPETLTERHHGAAVDRNISYEPALDGMAWLHRYGPAVEVLREYETLTAMATRAQTPDEPRTINQLRSDILSELILDGSIQDKLDRIERSSIDSASASRGTSKGTAKGKSRARRSARPRVLVTVPVLTLLGKSEEPGTLEGYGPISAQTARELAAEAPSFHRLLTHPVSGVVLSLDRTSYRVPADLRRWVNARDGSCRGPCCNRPASGTDIDHTIDWARGGTTDGHNLASLCRRDHVTRHRLGWRVDQDDDGVLTWTSPTGRTYTTEPEMAFRQAPPSADAGAVQQRA